MKKYWKTTILNSLKCLLCCGLCCLAFQGYSQNFNDGIGSDQIGDFPSKWDLLQGTAQVNILDGEKVIQFGDNGTVAPLIDIDDYLGDEFLVMFDLLFDDVRKSITYQHYMVRLWPGVSSGKIKIDERNLSFRGFKIHRHGVGTNYKDSGPDKGREYSNYLSELKTKEKVWRAVKIAYKKGNLKVFMDDKMVLNIPRYEFDPQTVSIEAASQGELTRAIKNVSIRGNGVTNSKPIDTNTEEVTEPELENPNSDPETPESEKIDIQSGEPILNEYPNDTLKNEETKTPGILDEESRESVLTKIPERSSDVENTENLELYGSEDFESPCVAMPSDETLDVLMDSTSLFNKRLDYLKNYSIEDLRGIPKLELIDGKFVMPPKILAFSTSANDYFTIIPLVFHVVRRSNQSGNLTIQDVYSAVEKTNLLFKPFGVYFTVDKLLFIDDDSIYNQTFQYELDIHLAYAQGFSVSSVLEVRARNISRKLNIYCIPRSADVSWSSFPSKNSFEQHIIMNNGHMKDKGVLAHEIGHWFNLLHTFESVRGEELASGNNCRRNGDLCCDTPADYGRISKVVDSNCNYNGTRKDKKGNSYNPDPENIMAYTRDDCRNRFSDQQIKRMYNSYLGMEQDRGYTFKVHGEIGELKKPYTWSAGWDNVQTYQMGSNTYLFLLKSTSGPNFDSPDKAPVHIHKFKPDGTVGENIFDRTWSAGWTTARVFGIGARKFLLLLKQETGDIHIHKINTDGTIGERTFDEGADVIGKGWSDARIFFDKYLFLLNKDTGDMHVHHFDINTGTVGAIVNGMDQKWTPGWDVTEQDFSTLLLYKSETGDIHIQKMRANGSFENPFYNKRWTGGWSTISFLRSLDQKGNVSFRNFLLLRDTDGHIKQTNWDHNNDVPGTTWFDNKKTRTMLGPGWSSVNQYVVNDGSNHQNYAFLMNKDTGEARVYNLNNNMK